MSAAWRRRRETESSSAISLSCRVFFQQRFQGGDEQRQLLFESGEVFVGPGEVTVASHLFKVEGGFPAARAPKLLTDPFKVWAAAPSLDHRLARWRGALGQQSRNVFEKQAGDFLQQLASPSTRLSTTLGSKLKTMFVSLMIRPSGGVERAEALDRLEESLLIYRLGNVMSIPAAKHFSRSPSMACASWR